MNNNSKLYADDHPSLSTKGTGFKDEYVAKNTIKIISKRSLKYQFDVINTMYNRAKFHPNQTLDMKKAMNIFNIWLNNYKKIKEKENNKYKFLSLSDIEPYENLVNEYNINNKYKEFLKIYKNVKKSYKLQYILTPQKEQDYYSYRITIINSILQKIKQNKTKLFYTTGTHAGMPSRQHLILILHAYSPLNINK
jgi:hypothetical protein